MIQAESLRYVAIPANCGMRFKHMPEVIQLNCIPTQQLSIRAEKSRLVVHPMKFLKRLIAVDAILSAVPSH
jgi:hypothetical protein